MPIHDTGVWLDDDGNVVYEQPEGRSTQLVAPGGEVSKAVRSRIESYGLEDVNLPDDETQPASDGEDEVEAVTTDDLQPEKPKRTRKSSK